ncbi:right-handed parallel beta-helix repeat-containing protein, partial [Akkermansiaceae bacterium]|nr:right-handed parallel beta-helix repeat-containing protein [Akkermansiaceae bacterium]
DPEPDGKSRIVVHVDSLEGLREAVAGSNQQIVLKPGSYSVSDRRGFRLGGSNNDVNLFGASINVPLGVASGRTLFQLSGDRISLRGGTIEDTYPNGMTKVTDFGAYNQGRKFGGMNEMRIHGDDNRVIGMKMTVRGSFPYGYGNMYGIGGGAVIGLDKHCGIQITGDRALIDGCELKMEAFGHAIYVQGGDRTTVRNTVVEGTVRPSNDCYEEKERGDLARRFNYQLQWPDSVRGLPIPRDHMINCTEDGIRAYKGAGEMIVENCTVRKCRGGIKLYMAKGAKVTNCQVLDCVVQGYSLPSRGVIQNSSGNAAYGPLLYVHSDNHSRQQIDLKVLPSPHSLGDHPLAALKGGDHKIRLTGVGDHKETRPRPIIVGYFMRFDFLCVDYPNVPKGHEKLFAKHSPESYKAAGINLVNDTVNPVVLGNLSRANSVTSKGEIRDLGLGNRAR